MWYSYYWYLPIFSPCACFDWISFFHNLEIVPVRATGYPHDAHEWAFILLQEIRKVDSQLQSRNTQS